MREPGFGSGGMEKSSAVARALGIPYSRLFSLIREGKITPPAKDGSGDYVWSALDVERARRALLTRRGQHEAVAGEQLEP
jgi:hypothetical protein